MQAETWLEAEGPHLGMSYYGWDDSKSKLHGIQYDFRRQGHVLEALAPREETQIDTMKYGL